MRAPRRSFASPFVVTLAAIPVAAACNPPPPHRPVTVRPQEPQPKPEPPKQDTTIVVNPPRPMTDPIASTEPTKTPPTTTLSWHVVKKGGTCQAFDNNACKVPAGQPAPPCNPPAPRTAACPDGLADGANVTVTQMSGQLECVVLPPPIKCKPGATCNPPPPRKVACPF